MIVKDVLVKIRKFIYLVDFFELKMSRHEDIPLTLEEILVKREMNDRPRIWNIYS